ncbi:MAG TPA: amidohydrolase family protein [Streptosporangiaceae bacterium]
MQGTSVDPGAVTAIDVHVHVHASVRGTAVAGDVLRGMAEYFRADDVTAHTTRDIAAYYRQRNMAAVVFGVDIVGDKNRDAARSLAPSNEEVAELAAENADVLIPFVSIDPARGAEGVRMARELLAEHPQIRGFKLHPSAQAFYPNDRSVYPLYEVIAEHQRIVLFHTGHTGVGAGTRGGGGIRLKYANPMYVDDVAVDFPDMPIILAHPSFPWQDEALSVALHKPQVYIDLSGWSPKYFPPQLVQYANTLLKHKMLFGSDFPMITPDRWLADFDKIDIRPAVRPLILKDNAVRLFGLEPPKPDDA